MIGLEWIADLARDARHSNDGYGSDGTTGHAWNVMAHRVVDIDLLKHCYQRSMAVVLA